MKQLLCFLTVLTTLAASWAAIPGLLWDGAQEGKELVTIGHKQVTILLADGRTASIGVPILVEKENAYQKALDQLRARGRELTQKISTLPQGTAGPTLKELEDINLKISQIEQQLSR